MSEIGVAVIGLGVGEQHAKAYLATRDCRLLWLHDLDRAKTQSVVDRLGEGKAAESFEQILSDPDVRIVSIASYDDAHFEQVIAALEAGKHVFVEKPMCRAMYELKAVKQAWSKHGGRLKLASNLVLRAAPAFGWLKERIDRKELGEVYAFDGDYLYGRIEKITDGWRKSVRNYSVIKGGGVHLIDLMLWLTGERPTTVYATSNRICTRGTEYPYDDFVAATLKCSSGMTARITANFGCVHRHQHVVRVFCTGGTFISDDTGPRMHTTRDPQTTADPIPLSTLPSSKGDLIAPFVAAVLNDECLDGETQSFFDGISICAACDKSLAANSQMEIEYV